MISRDEIRKIGRVLKPYSYRGEVLLLFDRTAFAEIEPEFYFCEMDGLRVPFFAREIKRKGDNMARVKFDDVDSDTSAARLSNVDVYLPKSMLREIARDDEFYLRDFIGFRIFDNNSEIGIITEVDESTINALFYARRDDNTVLIPATEDFIECVDFENKKLFMRLPHGLLP